MKLRNGKTIENIPQVKSVSSVIPSVIAPVPVSKTTGAKPKKTPENKHFVPAFIGEGTYGKVYKISESTIRKDCFIIDKDDGDLASENFLEAMFLSTFDAPFIPHASRIKSDLKSDKLSIFERYSGETLSSAARRLSYEKRVQLLPTIMCQMGRILMWMKSHHLAHMDIKPGNICIDSDNSLTLIDWGFVGVVGKTFSTYTGTEVFADPHYLVENTPLISHEYDMFGMGMTICSFIYKSYSELDEWKGILDLEEDERQEAVYSIAGVNEELLQDFEQFLPGVGTQLFGLLKKMLDLNPQTRLRPAALYTSPLFRDLWEKYPIHTVKNAAPKYSLPMSQKFADYLQTPEHERLIHFFSGYADLINLANKFFHAFSCNPDSNAHSPDEIFLVCLYLADIIMQENFDFECVPRFSKCFSTKKEFIETMIDVLDVLRWKCFDADFLTLPDYFVSRCYYIYRDY